MAHLKAQPIPQIMNMSRLRQAASGKLVSWGAVSKELSIPII